jgi:hypothetical protein
LQEELNLSTTPNGGAILDVPSNSGGFVVRETVRFAFFIRRRHLDVAPTAVEAIGRLIDLFPPPALSMFSIESGDWLKYDAQGLKEQVRERLVGEDRPINGTASLSGDQANIPDFGVEYAGLAIDRPTFSTAAVALWFFVANSVFSRYRDPALRLSRELNRLLGCSAAYVDLALAGHRPRMQAMARRYRALDISDVRSVARDLGDKLPGVFWQNLLGPQLVAALGGRTMLASILSSEARVDDDGSGGLVITLGDVPTRGDVNRREGDADRIALARLAHDRGLLHVPRKVTYFTPEDDLSDKEAQEKWHLRLVV